ncbi:hypothetical protein V6N13_062081 [Hibiscus sabdariffa]|uniref:Uncharacterized protein n=1 Tax=Hibiscus sabdariffa TaxID=183260 RepID=A0ABR2PF92_9ROSI
MDISTGFCLQFVAEVTAGMDTLVVECMKLLAEEKAADSRVKNADMGISEILERLKANEVRIAELSERVKAAEDELALLEHPNY